MKKILIMMTSMNIGGVEKSLVSLLSEIPKDQFEITLLLLEKKGGFLEHVPEWVRVVEVNWYQDIKPIIMQPPHETVQGYLKNKQYLKIPFFIASYYISKYFDNRYVYYRHVMKEVPEWTETYDVAISYQGPTDIIDFFVANKVRAKKKISWIHFDISKHLINQKLYERLYKQYDQIFAVSNEARSCLVGKIPSIKNKTDVFYNIVPETLIWEMSQEEIEFDQDYQGIKIVTVGRLSFEKGQDLAIKTLAKLRAEGIEVRWYCIGEGNYRMDCKKLIEHYGLEDDFMLLGATVNPYPYIAKADIYVQTSRHEGYCLTLAEAKCLQKPIVTTNFIGAYEQIIDGETGYIVECDAEELYQRIQYLGEERLERERLENNLSNIIHDSEKGFMSIFNIFN
ncbi:glycosyl transferase [Ammoniphilus oxalaticus]|uniref:Glycosyl transferase n=1 Tax=Ammoniphilus oxalaticus TaxID=66863 RepID=A0A419SHG5_9BACL|nr:glycosyltransferase [Ammoniphilus oxalaticus]RKD23175.1 glycosyl transferase [Ammoniphilus oxalaticus]